MDFDLPSRRVSRRQMLLTGAIGAAGVCGLPVHAQDKFPNQPVKVVIPFGPGGFADVTTRVVGQKLSEKLGQQVVADNRPGAGGVLAATTALTAPRDGHTLILFSNGTTIATSLMKLPYNPQEDFEPLTSMAYFDLNLLVANNSPFTSLAALVAEGKKRTLNLASINPGSTQHLSAALFRSVTGIKAELIPVRTSGEVQTALQRGDVDLGFETYAALRGGIDGKLLRALATSGPRRTPWLPEVPTVREAGVANYEVVGWNAFYAPKGVPAPVRAQLVAAIRDVLADPDMQKRLIDLGAMPQASTPEEMAAVFERDRRKWAQVISDAGIKV